MPWWGTALELIVSSIAVAIAYGFINRSRKKPRSEAEEWVLRNPPSLLILGLVVFVAFGGIGIFLLLFPEQTEGMSFLPALFCGISLFGAPLIYGYFKEDYRLSESGMQWRSFTGIPRFIEWASLKSVRYDFINRMFRLQGEDGAKVSISTSLMGLPTFARLILLHAPHAALEPKTLPILQETAAGNPPLMLE